MATDPLAGPSIPTIGAIPQPNLDGVSGALNELTAITEATTEAIEAMLKVIECYGCGEYALDGTFTAYMTDGDGEQPFCPECVSCHREAQRAGGGPVLRWFR